MMCALRARGSTSPKTVPKPVNTCGFPKPVLGLLVLLATAIPGLFASNPGCVGGETERPYGIQQRIPWTTSRIKGTPEPPKPFLTERVFPSLAFRRPVDLIAVPGTNRMLVVEVGGRLLTFDNRADASEATLAADMTEITGAQDVDDARMVYGFAFHPDFQRNRLCFICYVRTADDPHGTRVSRFRASSIDPLQIDLASEEIVITWLAGGHNGGSLQFGPNDGMLYISTGDGGAPFPPDGHRTGQDVSDLLASILRIDVDHPTSEKRYSVPPDNPFVGVEGARGEIWSYGHRNPWRMSFDAHTGDLWIGDVGWEMWEMIYRAERGANFGWSILEHTQPVNPDAPRGPTPITPPAAAHSHTESRSISGGYVYRGRRLPELVGKYVYGDYVTGRMWGLDVATPEAVPQELADTTMPIVCFGLGADQELYVVEYGGTIHRIVRNSRSGEASEFPRRLSDTGLFASAGDHELAAGVIPYAVNAEPWFDGTTAIRFVALPGHTKLDVHKTTNTQLGNIEGEWSFPDGAVLGRTVLLQTAPEIHQRLETQILHRNGDQWEAYSFVWNSGQDDAELADARGFDRTFEIQDASAPNGTRRQTWRFAGRTECILCHTARGGSIYGFRAAQLNRDFAYTRTTDNQLRTLAHIGLFEEPFVPGKPVQDAPPENFPRMVSPADTDATLSERARSYLHLNCATCHRRGGGGTASIELVLSHSLAETRLVSRPTQGTFGIVNPWIVAPRDPSRSVLFYRMSKLGRGRMPHFGSQTLDTGGLALIREWIERLAPPENIPESAAVPDEVLRLRNAVAGSLKSIQRESGASSDDRRSAVDRLLSTTSGALELAAALRGENQELVAEARELSIAHGASHADPTIRDLFEPFLPEQSRTRRLGTAVDPQSILALDGNAERGRKLFRQSQGMQCRNCHRVADAGKSVGPDLTRIGQRLGPGEILENILDPSRKIDPKFRTWLLQTDAGRLYSGLLIERSDELVVIRDSTGRDIRIPAPEIELLVAQKKSLMPDLLLRDASAQDAADLLAFLKSLK